MAPGADDDDPIVATYPVFVKPPLPAHRSLVVLQYVNKPANHPDSQTPPRLTELRVKPKTGMLEVDMPLDTHTTQYDPSKGVGWGVALQRSMEAKKGGSMGLAGGLGVGAPATRGRPRAGDDYDVDRNMGLSEALRQDKVLRTMTLGGGRSAEEDYTKHMVGVFQGSTYIPQSQSSPTAHQKTRHFTQTRSR
jgi:DNA-directed RNA polymerase III subunit RPC5